MGFGHEKLDVYQLSLKYYSFVFERAKSLSGLDRYARDQLLRSAQSIPQNIAEGNGKGTDPDRRRFFVPSRRRQTSIARGSALECAATQDLLEISEAITNQQNEEGKEMLIRIVSMLTKLGDRPRGIGEDPSEYGREKVDPEKEVDHDYDNENDNDRGE